jgi:hypothetical protein
MPLPRRLLASDLLYRRLDPYAGYWDRDRLIAHALAFSDDRHPDYEGLSFGVAKVHGTPARFLASFAGNRDVRAACGIPKGDSREGTLDEILRSGFGVAVVTVSLVRELGLDFIRMGGEHDYTKRGHADVRDGRSRAAAFALRARVLSEGEIRR